MYKNIKYVLFLSITLTFSCQNASEKKEGFVPEAKGGVYYGGVFRMNEVENFRNLYPLNVTEVTSHRIVNQIYEGLVKFSQKDLTIVPGIAERWESNENSTVYTFYLRKGVFYHDDACFPDGKGREVNAHDFKYCFDKLCQSDPSNQGFWVFKNRVKGADECYQATYDGKQLEGGVSGVTVVDDYTLKIELIQSFASFLHILGMPFTYVFPKEAVEKYGIEMRTKCIGTGPFKLQEIKEDNAVILIKNQNYWGIDEFGNKLPYLDAIKFSFVKDKKSELLEFKKGNLDMIYQLPSEMIDEIIMDLDKLDTNLTSEFKQFEVQIIPSLTLHYYGFLNVDKTFSNVDVRKAFNYAIDRRKIVDFTLQGEGVPATYGVVPPAFPDYDAQGIVGFDFDSDKAKYHLSKAGFPNGKNFPELTLQLNSGGTRNLQIAEVLQKMLKDNLNINVKLNVMPMAQHYENVETGKCIFWRAGWVADYPDPENFLTLFYGAHVPPKLEDRAYLNSYRYKSTVFDSLLNLALQTSERSERYRLYKEADQQVIKDAVVIPLFYDENIRLLQPYVMNFDINAMEYRDLSKVYFDKKKTNQSQL